MQRGAERERQTVDTKVKHLVTWRETNPLTLAYFNNSVFLTVPYESRVCCKDRGHAVHTKAIQRSIILFKSQIIKRLELGTSGYAGRNTVDQDTQNENS